MQQFNPPVARTKISLLRLYSNYCDPMGSLREREPRRQCPEIDIRSGGASCKLLLRSDPRGKQQTTSDPGTEFHSETQSHPTGMQERLSIYSKEEFLAKLAEIEARFNVPAQPPAKRARLSSSSDIASSSDVDVITFPSPQLIQPLIASVCALCIFGILSESCHSFPSILFLLRTTLADPADHEDHEHGSAHPVPDNSRNVYKIPPKRSFKEPDDYIRFYSLHHRDDLFSRNSIEPLVQEAPPRDDLAWRHVMLDEKAQLIDLHRLGVYSKEELRGQLAQIEARYADETGPSPAKRQHLLEFLVQNFRHITGVGFLVAIVCLIFLAERAN
ncbi:hypothetical protein B0H14DRAFT_2568927 [Mycena olivaceomarginata]|nr:hypothetical protein B0H14DRAFT_2568927 [Mycena olivaceomarginata]